MGSKRKMGRKSPSRLRGPNFYSFPSHSAFDEALARGLIERYGHDSAGFAEGVILVASRGVRRVLADALTRVSDNRLPLPRIVSLGSDEPEDSLADLLGHAACDDLPPTVAPLCRRMMLARIIRATGAPVDNSEAFRLAGMIANIIDEVYDSELSLAQMVHYLAAEAPTLPLWSAVDLAGSSMERWDGELARLGRIDAKVRRGHIVERLCRKWIDTPPSHFVCVADVASGGPAVMGLLRTVADLPDGFVVLAGFSPSMNFDRWSALNTSLERRGFNRENLRRDWKSVIDEAGELAFPEALEADVGRFAAVGGRSRISTGKKRAADPNSPAQRHTEGLGEKAMRFQANPPDVPGGDAGDFDSWLARQPRLEDFLDSADEGALAPGDFYEDHPDDWADDGDDIADIQGDGEEHGDDPAENDEALDDDYDPDIAPAPADAMYPQHHFKELLQLMGVSGAEVRSLDHIAIRRSSPARSHAIDMIFGKPGATGHWMVPPDPALFGEVHFLEAHSAQEEALAIATALREAAASPDPTAALFTPDRDLVRRVIAICTSWNLPFEDHVGEQLSLLPVGSLLLALVRAANSQDPASRLAVLQHPAIRLADRRAEARGGSVAVPGVSEADDERQAAPPAAADQANGACDNPGPMSRLLKALRPLQLVVSREVQSLSDLVVQLRRTAEQMAASPLWDDEPGQAAFELLEALATFGGETRANIETAAFEDLLRDLLGDISVPVYGPGPQPIAILGTDEARVHTPALMIIAGLSERHWPSEAGGDPWLSARIRDGAYLPTLLEPVGLRAHAMVQALGAKRVLLTRSKSDRGGCLKPSQHWFRLETLAGGPDRLSPPGRF